LLTCFTVPKDQWPPGWYCAQHEDRLHRALDVDLRKHFIYIVPYEIGQKARIPKNTFDHVQATKYLVDLKKEIDNNLVEYVGKYGARPSDAIQPIKINYKEKKEPFMDHTHLNQVDADEQVREYRKGCVRVPMDKTKSTDKPTRLVTVPTISPRFLCEKPAKKEVPTEFTRKTEFHEMADPNLEIELENTKPYIMWSFPSSSYCTDQRFRHHNRNMIQRKQFEKLGKFDMDGIVSMNHYKCMVRDAADGDDITAELEYQKEKRFCMNNGGVRNHLNVNGYCTK